MQIRKVAHQRPRGRKQDDCRLVGLLAIVLCSLLISAYGPAGYTSSDDGQPLTTGDLKAMLNDRPPPTSAASLLVVDVATDSTLWSSHEHERRAPASLTKLLTALLLMESGRNLDDVITVSRRAAETPGSTMGLRAGAKLHLSQLLAGLLLPSGNDAAVAIAEAVDGSVERFVVHMNARAQQLGLAESHFDNPDGLDAADETTSATDIARIARMVLQYRPVSDLIKTPALRLVGVDGTIYDLHNLNQLLGTYEGADGVKTGTTPDAGENLVASATRNGHRVLVVVLGSNDRYADARALLDYAWANWRWLAPALPPFALVSKLTPNGSPASIPLALRPAPPIPVHPWEEGPLTFFFHLAVPDSGTPPVPVTVAGMVIGSWGRRPLLDATIYFGSVPPLAQGTPSTSGPSGLPSPTPSSPVRTPSPVPSSPIPIG